ncbi:hypothetical protein CSB09_02720 [Candidatus Gracilibacteria bacterium]|nr:MAG: hypothetical protein CSB09_02720 [Candidatus Gracilibacteria bacterium]
MSKKSDKQNKQQLPKIPPNTKVKVIQITPKSIFTFLIIALLAWIVYSSWANRYAESVEYNDKAGLNQIVDNYKSGSYESIEITGREIQAKKPITETVVNGNLKKSRIIDRTRIPVGVDIARLGIPTEGNKTIVTVPDTNVSDAIWGFVPTLLGTLLLIFLFIFLIGRLGGGGGMGGPMAFIKSRAKVYDPEADEKVTFADVAGSEEEKADLEEVVDFLKNPGKYKKLGAKIPRGILLQGPPGTGKTLLARAVAGESNVPFFSISGSEFVEMFVGVGASRVRDLFKEAREKAPSIIFIDEIDAIGKRRSPGVGGGHDEREQTLNQILTEMDGFDNDTNVIVMSATNRADVLDKALLRPGRFDRKVTINLPTLEDRKKILEVHAKNKPFSKDVNWDKVAGITVGFSGAELGNLLNEAAILTGKRNKKNIDQEAIQNSIEKVVMGNQKKSLRMTDHEKWLTAVHEVGHAIVGKMLPHTDPVHKISILPRGGAGGVTWFLPEKDRTYTSKAKYIDELATLYGGRVSEEIFFGNDYITTGASNDIERATDIARAMVMKFGFDADLGAENYAADDAEGNFLGSSNQERAISDETRKLIDEKVRTRLKDAYKTASQILKKYHDLQETIAKRLLEVEEMDQEEFDAYFVDIEGVPEKVIK